MNKTISAQNNVKLGINDNTSDEDRVKFICEMTHGYQFVLPVLNEKGEKVFHTDANGNNKTPDVKTYVFTQVSGHKNADGKVDINSAFSFFEVTKKLHGEDYDRIVAKLDKDCKNPINKMYREDDHFKKRNPEAFRIASEKAALISENSEKTEALKEKDREIEELKKQLFIKKKG